MDAPDSVPVSLGGFMDGSSSTTATALCQDNLLQIYVQLKDLPSILTTREACTSMRDGPAASHVRTLQAIDDLAPPGSAWSRFSAADGLVLLVRHAYTQQQAVAQAPARARRLLVAQQQAAAQQYVQRADVASARSIGSIIAAGLAASACLGGLQQLAMDAPVSTAEVDVLLGMLCGLQQLELGQVRSMHPEQPWQPWQPAALPASMQSVRLQSKRDDDEHLLPLDVSCWAAAKCLRCLELEGDMYVQHGLGLLALGQLTSLSLARIPQDMDLDGNWKFHKLDITQLQQVRQLSLPYMECGTLQECVNCCTWQDLVSLQHLQQLVLFPCALPKRLPDAPAVLQRMRELKVRFLTMPKYEPPTAQQQAQAVQGYLTAAAPNLESLEVELGVWDGSSIADAAAALAGHTALASLSLSSMSQDVQHELAWPGQPLASISRLTRLVLRDLQEVDVSRGLLQDVAACAGLRELHLGLEPGTWSELGEAHRQQLVALQGQQGGRRCTIDRMCA